MDRNLKCGALCLLICKEVKFCTNIFYHTLVPYSLTSFSSSTVVSDVVRKLLSKEIMTSPTKVHNTVNIRATGDLGVQSP